MSLDKKIKNSKPALFTIGTVILVFGMALILVWWSDVVIFFRGFLGVTVALGGLLILYMVKE